MSRSTSTVDRPGGNLFGHLVTNGQPTHFRRRVADLESVRVPGGGLVTGCRRSSTRQARKPRSSFDREWYRLPAQVPYPAGDACMGRVIANTVVPSTRMCSMVPAIASINVLATESPSPRLPRTVTEAGSWAKARNGFARRLRVEARTGVADGQPVDLPGGSPDNLYRLGPMGDGVGDEVAKGMLETGAVDLNQAGVAVDLDVGPEPEKVGEGAVDHLGDAGLRRVVADVFGVDPSSHEDVVDHSPEVARLFEDRCQPFLHQVRIASSRAEGRQIRRFL